MNLTTFRYWLLGIVVFLFIGFIITLVNLNSYSYYQSQHYNNLPSLTEADTAPIEHYQEQVDSANEQTEAQPEAEVTEVNGTNADMFTYASDGGAYLLPPLVYADGSVNIVNTAVLMGLTLAFHMGLFPIWRIFGLRIRHNMFGSMILAIGVLWALYLLGIVK